MDRSAKSFRFQLDAKQLRCVTFVGYVPVQPAHVCIIMLTIQRRLTMKKYRGWGQNFLSTHTHEDVHAVRCLMRTLQVRHRINHGLPRHCLSNKKRGKPRNIYASSVQRKEYSYMPTISNAYEHSNRCTMHNYRKGTKLKTEGICF